MLPIIKQKSQVGVKMNGPPHKRRPLSGGLLMVLLRFTDSTSKQLLVVIKKRYVDPIDIIVIFHNEIGNDQIKLTAR